MAAITAMTLGRALALAVTIAVLAACGSGYCGTCPAPYAYVRTDVADPLRVTMCLDDDCRDLDDGRVVESGTVNGEFSGFDDDIPDGDVRIEVTVRDADGDVLATFDDTREPANDGCCGRFIAFFFDGDELRG